MDFDRNKIQRIPVSYTHLEWIFLNVLSKVNNDSAVIPILQLVDCPALPFILLASEPSDVLRP